MTRRFAFFAAANAFALAWTLFAVTRPWISTISEDPQRELVQRTLLFALVGLGVVATLAYAAVPTTALNTAFDDKLQEILDAIFGASPIGWLPSFQPTTPDWYIGAYIRVLPAMASVAALAWLGIRAKARP